MTMLELNRLTKLTGFGRADHRLGYLYRPTRSEQIGEVFDLARRHGLSVGLRGAGRSYGDAALNAGQIVLDLQRMNRILDWDPERGVIRMEPGVTIGQLWQYTLEDGWWPAVVPGTMAPTVGGCLAMNVHGKNNYRAGTFGDHVLAFTALFPNGEEITCTPTETPELFYSMVSGLGLLGVFTSITLQLKRVYSGDLQVEAWAPSDLETMVADLEARKSRDEYLVGWIDGLASGARLGRGQIHTANHLQPGEDPHPYQSLRVEYQTLPDTLLGVVPASILWRLMSPWMNDVGTRLVNAGKYWTARLAHHKTFRQPHAAFHFLLDYIPNWIQAYGPNGLIQYQSFVPAENAVPAFREMLALTQRRGLPSYLAVIKRHRPDDFLLSHAVDGFSLALDFKITRSNRQQVQHLCNELSQIVLEAGGRFYFAKDSSLSPNAARQFLGTQTIERFNDLKARFDPEGLFQTDLYRRVFGVNGKPY